MKDQYRHCKPILARARAASVLRAAGIPDALPDGQPDPGLLAGEAGEAIVDAFLTRWRGIATSSAKPIRRASDGRAVTTTTAQGADHHG